MGFFNAILDAIADNYIFFVAITIFLVLSLVGFYVDKKTRKDADITPIFGNKLSLNIKKKDPSVKKDKKGKKGKKGFTTTIVGGEDSAPAGVATVANQNLSVGQAPVPEPVVNQNVNQNIQPTTGELNNYAQGFNQAQAVVPTPAVNEFAAPATQVQTLPDGTVVDPSLFADIPGQAVQQSVMPAAETAQIADTILPNVATSPVQAEVQGVSAAAPGMEAIVPSVGQETPAPMQNSFENEAVNLNMMGDDEGAAMNFNMSED